MLESKRATNIQQVAKLAGCSQVTVARVFAEKVKVSEKTRVKVLKAAQELGYAPNILARGLRGGNTDSVALLFFMQEDYGSIPVPRIISELLWNNDAKTSFTGMLRMDIIKKLLRDYLRRKVDGIIIEWAKIDGYPFLAEHAKLLEEFPAAVIISAENMEVDIDQIIWDRGAAIREAAEHFISSGRNKIGLLMCPASNKTKREAFDAHMLENGRNPSDGYLFPLSDMALRTAKDCFDFLSYKYPDGKIPYDSLICGNDHIAIAAINWLSSRGYKIPADVAVVGFDNFCSGEFLSPPLASVERRHQDIGVLAYKLLTTRMSAPGIPLRKEIIPMKFICRESAEGNAQ